MRWRHCLTLLVFTLFITALPGGAGAQNRTLLVIKTVLASQGPSYLDPKLTHQVQEFQSLFRYSAYRLLHVTKLVLPIRQSTSTRLPGNRFLKISADGISGNRIALGIDMFRRKQLVFHTAIRLMNHGSITLGGALHEGGVLLLNISASF